MGDGGTSSESSAQRKWVPLAAVGGVGLVAAAVAAVLIVPALSPAAAPTAPPASHPANSESPAPRGTPAQAPAGQTSSPTADCTVSPIAATQGAPLVVGLPGAGPSDDIPLTTTNATVDGLVTVGAVLVDDRRTAIIVGGGRDQDELVVFERGSGEITWSAAVAPNAVIVSTPSTTGVADVLVVFDSAAKVMTSHDVDNGDLLAERVFDDWMWAASAEPIGGSDMNGRAPVAVKQDAVFAYGAESAHRLDPMTLSDEWVVDGTAFDVAYVEGGIPFFVLDDVFFVDRHALDAATGDPLGWELDGHPATAGGAALTTTDRYMTGSDVTLKGIDLTSGSACWTLEVASAAGNDDQLWVVDKTGRLARIDPFTGETLEERGEVGSDSVQMIGSTVVTLSEDRHTMTVRATDGSSHPTGVDPRGRVAVSSDAIIALHGDANHEPTSLSSTALSDGRPLWTERDGRHYIGGGVIIDADGDRTAGAEVTIELLR